MIVSFLAIPLLDSLAGLRKFPSLASFGIFAHWVPRLYFLLHFYLLYVVLSSFEFTSFMDLLANGLALGTITGGIGITIAHELMHRTKKVDRFLSKLIMASVLYGHFCIGALAHGAPMRWLGWRLAMWHIGAICRLPSGRALRRCLGSARTGTG